MTQLKKAAEMTADSRPPFLLEGQQHLQVTPHNRLLGSTGGVVRHNSWLHAFSWALFPDPSIVWTASEVSDFSSEGAVQGIRYRREQWIVSSGGEAAATLSLTQVVPPLLWHIWALPLAGSGLPKAPLMNMTTV